MAEGPNILVVGSINMDLVVRGSRIPSPGETVLGEAFVTNPGGKGANQAVAVARLGGRCRMIGRVGDDAFGPKLLKGLADEGVDCTDVMTTKGAASGVAMIIVDRLGENAIVVAGGANTMLTPDDLFARAGAFKQTDVLVVQLELPLPTVRAAIDLARRGRCKIVLDPAPAPRPMPADLCQVDVLTPNVSEAEIITGHKAVEERVDKHVAADLIELGAKAAVLKLGGRGCLAVDADGHFYRVPACRANVVDTTAAGDAFTGALAVAVAEGRRLHNAAKFATAAGSLACTKMGAQAAMPTLAQVKALVDDQL